VNEITKVMWERKVREWISSQLAWERTLAAIRADATPEDRAA
jgi:hypothetical protein